MNRVFFAVGAVLVFSTPAYTQNRGVYPLGMSAINSGVTPQPGVTYANQLLVYSRDRATDGEGQTVVTGANAVVMDMNTLTWVSGKQAWGARYSASATIPVAKNSLTSDIHGPISGGGGLADSYYLPVIMGWNGERSSIRAMYGFLAPTGSFAAGASDNVGSGYWTHTISSGQTIVLTQRRSLTVSAYQMYEFHSTQQGTGIHPGDTLDVDYSVMGSLRRSPALQIQAGVVGYEQRQMTAKSGPDVTPELAAERYGINALGFALSMMWPAQQTSVSVRYFKEFATRSTFEGYSLQIAASIGL